MATQDSQDSGGSRNVAFSRTEDENVTSSSDKEVYGLEECLLLLESSVDEKRLVGILLASKLVSASDTESVRKVFKAIGFEFINRLLKTAFAPTAADENETFSKGPADSQKSAFASMAICMLSAFCRLPELAESDEMVSKVPLLVHIIRSRNWMECIGDACECLLGIASMSAKGLQSVKEEDVVGFVAASIQQATQVGTAVSSWVPAAVRLFKYVLTSVVDDMAYYDHKTELAAVVPSLAQLLAERSDMTKFDVLAILVSILSSEYAESICGKLGELHPTSRWTEDIRTGVGHILHSRIGDSDRQASLQLASMTSRIAGENWLVGPIRSAENGQLLPPSRFFFLLLESVRVEVPLSLDHLARLIFTDTAEDGGQAEQAEDEACFEMSSLSRELSSNFAAEVPSGLDRRGSMNLSAFHFDTIDLDIEDSAASMEVSPRVPASELAAVQKTAGDCFALLEQLIGVLASWAEPQEGHQIDLSLTGDLVDSAVAALDETIGVIIEFIVQAKEYKKSEDNGVLACVRVMARFLAEAPGAHRKKVAKLLAFMMTVKATDEERPIQAIQFLLPTLLQVTCEPKMSKIIVKNGGLKSLVAFVQERSRTSVMGSLKAGPGGHAELIMACDVLLNLFSTLQKDEQAFHIESSDVTPLLSAIVSWTSASDAVGQQGAMNLAMAGCIGASVLELTSEEAVRARLDLAAYKRLPKAVEIILKFLEHGSKRQGKLSEGDSEKGLWEIAMASCFESLHKWPLLKRGVEKSELWARLSRRALTRDRICQLVKEPKLQAFLCAVANL